MLNSCIVASVGLGYENLISNTFSSIPNLINKIFIINDTGGPLKFDLEDKRISILNNKTSIGLSASLKKWSEEYYKYDLVFRLDIGDKSLPERFINQYNFMEENPNCVLCGYETKLILPGYKNKYSFNSLNSNFIKLILLLKNCFVHGSICIRSKTLKKAGGYSSFYESCQDIEMYLRIMKFGDLAILNGSHHTHKFQKELSTTFIKRKQNYKTTSIIRFKKSNEGGLSFPLLLISSAYYYIKYLIQN